MSEVRPAIIVSACLLGVACNHRGLNSPSAAVAALADEARLIPICPEVAERRRRFNETSASVLPTARTSLTPTSGAPIRRWTWREQRAPLEPC